MPTWTKMQPLHFNVRGSVVSNAITIQARCALRKVFAGPTRFDRSPLRLNFQKRLRALQSKQIKKKLSVQERFLLVM